MGPTIDQELVRVIGVMPEGFAFPDRETAMWTPFAFTEEQRSAIDHVVAAQQKPEDE